MHLTRAANGQYGSEGVFSAGNISKVRSKLDSCSSQLKNALVNKPYELSHKDVQEMVLQPPHTIDLAEDGWIGKFFYCFIVLQLIVLLMCNDGTRVICVCCVKAAVYYHNPF